MRSFKSSILIPLLAVAVSAQATVVTPALPSFPVGADVSVAFPGVTFTQLQQPAGIAVYAPVAGPAILTACGLYGACPQFSVPVNALGGNVHSMGDYRDCYNATRLGHTALACATRFSVMEAKFTRPTDFVEFELTWFSDPPLLIAYDAAGNQILSCYGSGVAGCAATRSYTPGLEYSGTVRLSIPTPKIARVVVGSNLASARIIGLQYNNVTPLVCP